MSDEHDANAWINDPKAPTDIRTAVEQYRKQNGKSFQFTEHSIRMWLIEFICDLFGLLLFGPGFLAAHRTLLKPMHPSGYTFDLAESTHPPYAARHKMLVQAMYLLGWDKPLTDPSESSFHQAELQLLKYVLDDTYDSWAVIFDTSRLSDAIAGMRKIFVPHPGLSYAPTDGKTLVALVDRLTKSLPPILANIDLNGCPVLQSVEISQTLYAGWVYWEGRDQLSSASLSGWRRVRWCVLDMFALSGYPAPVLKWRQGVCDVRVSHILGSLSG